MSRSSTRSTTCSGASVFASFIAHYHTPSKPSMRTKPCMPATAGSMLPYGAGRDT